MFEMAFNLILEIMANILLFPIRVFLWSVVGARNKVFYVLWGQNRINSEAAAKFLIDHAIPPPAISYMTQGGGVYGIRLGRFMTELSGNGGSAETTSGDYRQAVGSGQGFMNAGFLIKRGSYIRLYPLVGVGGNVDAITETQKNASGEKGIGAFQAGAPRQGGRLSFEESRAGLSIGFLARICASIDGGPVT